MIDKKKLNFWRLVIIFSSYTGIMLLVLWMNPVQKASMMTDSMSGMASNMHLKNVTIYDLLENEMSGNANQMGTSSDDSKEQEDHAETESETKTWGLLTTIIIFALLPLIIGGSIILAIVWIK